MRQTIPSDQLPTVVHFLQLKCATDEPPERRDATACLLGLCGLRRQEILNLTAADLNDNSQSLWVATIKNGQERTVPLDQFTWSVLRRLGNATNGNGSFLFVTESGGRLDPRNLLRTWHRWSKQLLGRAYRFHDLRHTAAQIVYTDSGHDLIAVQRLLGHRSVSTTQEYLTSSRDVRWMLPTNKGLAVGAITLDR